MKTQPSTDIYWKRDNFLIKLFYFEIFEDSHAVISYGENPCAFT